jgi:hypothetical protein
MRSIMPSAQKTAALNDCQRERVLKPVYANSTKKAYKIVMLIHRLIDAATNQKCRVDFQVVEAFFFFQEPFFTSRAVNIEFQHRQSL